MGNPASDSEPNTGGTDGDMAAEPPSVLYSLLERLRSALTRPFDNRAIWQLRRQIEHQAARIRQAESALAGVEIFERSSMAARMGAWQCALPSERLTWSSGTYDLFGMRQNCGLVRGEILKSYSEASLARLQAVRSDAIRAGNGFTLDAEIESGEFGRRWIRIFATVERRHGEPVRLFGIKQDVTEEKKTLDHMRHLAEHDVMTGLANRMRFQARLADMCGQSGAGGVLMLVDLDGFKTINDTLGHGFGDECLIEFARRLSATCRSADLIARIGGDEFAILFGPSINRAAIERMAQQVVDAAAMPMNFSGRILNVNASIGFAFAEAETPAALFARADLALYMAKAAGGGAYRSPPASRSA